MAVSNEDLAESLGLSWSDTEFELAEFLDIFTLPQLVQIAEGNYGVSEETTLPAGQVLTLHVVKQTVMFRGYTYAGQDVYVPLNCPQKVEIRPQNVSLEYDTVSELCTVIDKVKYVRVTKDYNNAKMPERSLKTGQKLKLHYIEDKKSKTPLLICVDEQGCEVCLTMETIGGFQPLLNNKEYFLMELQHQFCLPIYVQFTSPPEFNISEEMASKFNKRFLSGMIQLDDVIVENIVIASSRETENKTILTFPRTLDVSVIVPQQALAKDATYARVCATLNDGVDLVKVEEITLPKDNVIYGTRSQVVREFSYTKFTSGGKSRADVKPSGVQRTSQDDSDDDDDDYIDIDSALYDKIDEKFVERCRKLKSQGPSVPTPGITKSSAEVTRLHEKRKQDYEDVDICYVSPENPGYYPPQVQRGSNTKHNKAQIDQTKSATPEVAKTTEVGNVKSTSVWDMSVREVVSLLEELNMSEYGDLFEEEQVDGVMLKELDKSILQKPPFSMNKFHALKLVKAAEDNWRPNKQTLKQKEK